MRSSDESPFLTVPATEWLASNDFAAAIADGLPVAPGHALLIPRRLVASSWDATVAEQHALLAWAGEVKAQLEIEFAPDGWNRGVNVNEAGGQTVPICTCIWSPDMPARQPSAVQGDLELQPVETRQGGTAVFELTIEMGSRASESGRQASRACVITNRPMSATTAQSWKSSFTSSMAGTR